MKLIEPMRVLKLLIISVIVFFLLLTTFAALLPSEVRISRAIDINRPAGEIYPMIAEIRNWESWNLFIQKLENRQWEKEGVAGKTLEIIVKQKNVDGIVTEWKQPDGKKFTGGFNLIRHDSLTTVQWYFDFRFRWYPWEKFSSIVYDAQVGPPMQESLMNLKSVVENVR
jgi:hypothetical protein